ncbi:Sexual differentiation process protein isp4 [Penicillium odoratum]|uniref:Sexual differentiation process protein isp4 n=1 Tax=Penicillium odoratum TaxID=1167516 RepID=UPI002548A583|nr:Sexual differentiation process protein isp4 [Penicillium odoratum]KAJ5765813.1 Sexual differentiation process protein isp4 [Penicillium odoratum]
MKKAGHEIGGVPDANGASKRSDSMAEKDQVGIAVSTGVSADVEAFKNLNEKLLYLKELHRWDPNIPEDYFDVMIEALATDDKDVRDALARDIFGNSIYPEVRAAVSNIDEGGYCNTIRAWVIGMVFATVVAAVNVLFSLRNPTIGIPVYIIQLLSLSLGKACERWIPSREFRFFGIKGNLNPGPFSKKEHALIVIMANASVGSAYATNIITAQRMFYHQRFGWAFETFLCISNQMLGFGIAGLYTRFLVEPAAMIWPSLLISVALFDTLHKHSKPDPSTTFGWKISRYRFFLWVVLGSSCWYWFPGYIAPFLSTFAFVTWIKPQSVVINKLFGCSTGLSLIPLTFDWTQIAGYKGSPLQTPWFSICTTMMGMIFWYWVVTPAIHFSGMFYSDYLPISDSTSYDNTGKVYKASRILTPDFMFDLQKYQNYSPIFLSTTFMISYGLSFAAIISMITHVGLFHGAEIWNRIRHINDDQEDVHNRLMSRFKPVPFWWYVIVMVVMLAMALGIVLGYDTRLTWWAFLLAIFISVIWTLPIGLVGAMTNMAPGLNVFTEFIMGYMQLGKPMALMLFKAYGYITMSQALSFIGDLKMALFTSVVQILVLNWCFGNINDVCDPKQVNNFSCPNGRVYFVASIIWGTIGPGRIFSIGQMYAPMMAFWIVGLLLPIAVYVGARKFPRSGLRYFTTPVFFCAALNLPPATPLNCLSWGVVGFITGKWIRGRYRGWWMTYNASLSAALDVGLAITTLIIFFTLTMTNTKFPDWWGTTVTATTLDAQGHNVQKHVTDGEIYGPTSW